MSRNVKEDIDQTSFSSASSFLSHVSRRGKEAVLLALAKLEAKGVTVVEATGLVRCSQVMICFDICDLHLPVIGYLAKTAPHREPFPGCENLVEIDLKRSMIGLCEVTFAKLSEAAHLCPYARAHVCTGASLLWSKGRNFSIQVGAGSFKLFIVDLFLLVAPLWLNCSEPELQTDFIAAVLNSDGTRR